MEQGSKDIVLVVDDEPDFSRLLKRIIEADFNCCVLLASSAEEAMDLMGKYDVEVACLDIRMPAMDGFELLRYIRKVHPLITVIMITAFGCIEVAVKSIKEGAYDFITKPVEQDVFIITLKKALERSRLIRENLHLRESVKHYEAFHNIVGESKAMKQVFESIRMVAPTDVTVLIRGESGTGKELVARAIHNLSDRKEKPFIPVNCPALPEQILESELFGYKKGAFTQAFQDKKGLFQEAHGGTVFLDEIGDIPMTIQTKLLRVLQEKEIRPLGDNKTIKVDVRVIASTNQDLKKKMEEGVFREDLFYRLNVVPIHVPPLRERMEDIPLLVEYFLKKHGRKFNKISKKFLPESMQVLMNYNWKGNVRELENVVMRAMLFAPDDDISVSHLGLNEEETGHVKVLGNELFRHEPPYQEAKKKILKDFHERFFGRLFTLTRGNITQAAKLCGLERQALQHIVKKYGIDPAAYKMDDGEHENNL